jgi:hypothetical protein
MAPGLDMFAAKMIPSQENSVLISRDSHLDAFAHICAEFKLKSIKILVPTPDLTLQPFERCVGIYAGNERIAMGQGVPYSVGLCA